MTIKQQGGIFGRNPTFNDVEVEGSLTAQSPTFTGDMSVDGATLFVDASSNRVGLGTSSPAAAFHIEQGSPIIQFEDTDAGGVYSQINGSGTAGRLLFNADATNAGANTTIQFNIDGAEAASFNPSGLAFPNGKGIDFSATSGTGTSELFDDYEEGTWTPAYGTSGTPFDAITHNTQDGYYRKVGSLVVVNFFLRTTSVTVGSGTGAIIVTGLPFAAISARNPGGAVVNTFGWGVNAPRNVRASGSTLFLSYHNAANRTADNSVSDISAAGNNDCYATCIYYT